jgi:eukaryotic-like serine/threonine-protein kinase
MQSPPRHKDTKNHKGLNLIDEFLVNLGALVPLWQKECLLTIIFSLCLLSVSKAQSGDNDWPLFRGKADLAGKYDSELPSKPVLLWSVSTGARTKSSPVISEGVIYFGNDKGTLIAVTAEGKIKWKYESSSPVEAPPMVFGNKVIFGSADGVLKAIDKSSGKLIWSYTTDNQIAGSSNVWISGNKTGIVVGSYDYFLHCVDPLNGKPLWKVETENYVNGTPAILNGKIVFGGCDGMIRVVDPLTGKQKDTIDIGVYIAASPALSANFAYFGDYDGTLYCVSMSEKKIAWSIPGSGESGAILAIPAVNNNMVIVGSENKYLSCYNASDGKLRWKFLTNGRITGSAVITSTSVLFPSMDGNIFILAVADGKKLWSFKAGTPISSSPAIIPGKFFILTEDGRLLAFGDKSSWKK